MNPRTSTTGSPRRRAAIGIVAVTLTVGTTGVAYALATADRPAADVTAGGAAPPAPTADPTAEDVPPGPDEYTNERADAFWDAGYQMEDADALAALWHVDLIEAKGRAGRLLLDGQPVPIAPGSSLDLTDPSTITRLQLAAFWDAGYTGEDGTALAALWNVDVFEAKATAGQMLRDGQPLPLGPSGTPVS